MRVWQDLLDTSHGRDAGGPDDALLRALLAGHAPAPGGPVRRSMRGVRAGAPDDAAVLRALLEAPAAAASPWETPVALRSVEVLRSTALRGRPVRDRLDTLLRGAQYALLASALALGGYWLVDGVVRDWLAGQGRAAAAPVAPAPAPPPVRRAAVAAAVRSVRGDERARGVAGAGRTAAARLSALPPLVAPAPPPVSQPVIPFAAAAPKHNPVPVRLAIPAIGVDTPVASVFVVNDNWEVAEYAAGYMRGTGLPGRPGNVGISGHAGLRGAVFVNLPSLAPGADIFIDTEGWRHTYRVRGSQVVWPTQVEVLDQTATPTLTLITCTNWDLQRLVVSADLVGSQPLPPP